MSELYPPAAESEVLSCQVGVRALPPRSHFGYVPLAGELSGLLPGFSSAPSHVAAAAGTARTSSSATTADTPRRVTVTGESGAFAPTAENTAGKGRGGGHSTGTETVTGGLGALASTAENTLGEEGGGGKSAPRLWMLAGLGSRGLIHHALLGGEVARAVLAGDATHILEHARRWEKGVEDAADDERRRVEASAPRPARRRLHEQGSAECEYEGAEGGYR
jgi:hypothetical protein